MVYVGSENTYMSLMNSMKKIDSPNFFFVQFNNIYKQSYF